MRQREIERDFYSVCKNFNPIYTQSGRHLLFPLFGKSTQAHVGDKWPALLTLSVSLAVSGGCDDDRTWEPRLSYLRRSCLCSKAVLLFFFRFRLGQSCNISFSVHNMQTLFHGLSFFWWYIFAGFVRWKEEDQSCAWNSEFDICNRECNINLFCLKFIYWKTCLWIPNFREVIPSALALSLCWVEQDGCLYARMFECPVSKKKSILIY